MKHTIEPTLRYLVTKSPSNKYDVILRTDSHLKDVVEESLKQGATIHRRYRLIRALFMTATGKALLVLAQNPHVIHIELDQEVRMYKP